jgi:nucleoid-associated protein YgaU
VHYLAKHAPRKRRSIKARFAGIGVAGAATIAAGVATANEAKASSIWDSVAQCETGQNWATNSVPGYSGGLGFANRYWAAFGGTQYSALPYQATREQQIAVAQRILATNGPTAWPVCGPRAGLTKANGGAATTAAAPAAAAAAPSTSRSTTRTAPKATTTPKATTAKAAPKAAAKPAAKPANTAPAVSGNTVTVKAGDTLSELAVKLGVKGGWKALYAANTNLVKNPNLIYVGQVLRLPA